MAPDDSTSPSDKFAAFRARQAQKGLIQANEWIPSDQRVLFRAVAQALRDGEPVTIGAVASNPDPVASNPDPVASDLAPTPVASDLAPIPVASDPGPTDEEANAQLERLRAEHLRASDMLHAREKARKAKRVSKIEAEWLASTDLLQVIGPDGTRHEARVTQRTGPTEWERVEGVIRIGTRHVRLEYQNFPPADFGNLGKSAARIEVTKPRGFKIVLGTEDEIKRQREVVSGMHPDNGGPGGAEFKAAKAHLDALRGRK